RLYWRRPREWPVTPRRRDGGPPGGSGVAETPLLRGPEGAGHDRAAVRGRPGPGIAEPDGHPHAAWPGHPEVHATADRPGPEHPAGNGLEAHAIDGLRAGDQMLAVAEAEGSVPLAELARRQLGAEHLGTSVDPQLQEDVLTEGRHGEARAADASPQPEHRAAMPARLQPGPPQPPGEGLGLAAAGP